LRALDTGGGADPRYSFRAERYGTGAEIRAVVALRSDSAARLAVRSLAELVCGDSAIEALSPQQLGELAFLLEYAVRGGVSKRSLEAWLVQLREAGDRRAAAESLRARLVEKTNEVELGGRREAA
jgi:hypothetical protein